MPGEIGELERATDRFRISKRIRKLMHIHSWLLKLVRKYIKRIELITPALKSFARNILTVDSIAAIKMNRGG